MVNHSKTSGTGAVTAIILAGGMSRRLGRNKALEPFGDETLIRRVIGRVRAFSDAVLVVANDDARIVELDLPDGVDAVVDMFPDMGPLGGIATGLSAARTEWATFCACDMPFVSPALFRLLLSLRDGHDAVVPVIGGRPEPIHAAYSRACLGAVRDKIAARRLRASSFFGDVRVRLVSEREIRAADPELRSFFNVNTQDDLDKALRMAGL